jgi:tetratricopeptide (TPR) repeat protein
VPSEQISWVLVISARQEMKQPTHRTSIFSALLMMSVLLNARVLAQTATDWSRCIGGEGPIVDVVIEGCTAEIQAARDGSQKLATAFNNRGVAYKLKGEYDRALHDYDQAIRLDPTAKHYNNRGIIYRIKGDYDRAISDYDEAIRLRSDFTAAFYNRALALADITEYVRALADFDPVMQFDAKNALALYARGLTLLKKGDVEGGKADIAASKKINPNIA